MVKETVLGTPTSQVGDLAPIPRTLGAVAVPATCIACSEPLRCKRGDSPTYGSGQRPRGGRESVHDCHRACDLFRRN